MPVSDHNAEPLPPQPQPTGSTWVLLRGLTREQGHWGRFASDLQAALPEGSLVLTPDLPGNGCRWQERSPSDVPGMVSALRAQLLPELAELGRSGPCHVLAMSLGAMVTVAWAHQHPEEVQDAVLINTSLRPHSHFWQRLRPGNYARILGLLLAREASAEDWERAILAMTSRHPLEPQATLQRWLQLRQSHPVGVANGLRQLWAAARYRAPAGRLPVPVLLLNGLGDQLVHPDCSARLAATWQAPLLRHPTAGHDLPLDAGPWVIRQVLQWQASPR